MKPVRNKFLLDLGKFTYYTNQCEIIGYLLFANYFVKHLHYDFVIFAKIEILHFRRFGEIINGNIACVI